jgi:hypothetical protein
MVRWMLKVLTALSLLLCVLTAALWVCNRPLDFSRGNDQTPTSWNLTVQRRVKFLHRTSFATPIVTRVGDFPAGSISAWLASHPATSVNFSDCSWRKHDRIDATTSAGEIELNYRGIDRELTVPLWILFVASLLLPAVNLVANAIRQRGLKRAGCCTGCGYDVRATPRRCPECGTKIKMPPIAAARDASV